MAPNQVLFKKKAIFNDQNKKINMKIDEKKDIN
jgi:hypothetical protein